MRLSSPEFAQAVIDGLNDAGCDVVDIGLCGTEQVYFATFHLGLDVWGVQTDYVVPGSDNDIVVVMSEATITF